MVVATLFAFVAVPVKFPVIVPLAVKSTTEVLPVPLVARVTSLLPAEVKVMPPLVLVIPIELAAELLPVLLNDKLVVLPLCLNTSDCIHVSELIIPVLLNKPLKGLKVNRVLDIFAPVFPEVAEENSGYIVASVVTLVTAIFVALVAVVAVSALPLSAPVNVVVAKLLLDGLKDKPLPSNTD